MQVNPDWFGGNRDAVEVYGLLCRLADVWDNMIDGDKPVTPNEINDCFLTCLFRLPLNPVYRQLEQHLAPMWLTVVSAYETANTFEKEKDAKGIEMSHMLRYAAGNIVAYIITYCVGIEEARKHVPAMWRVLVREGYEDYRKEHLLPLGDTQ